MAVLSSLGENFFFLFMSLAFVAIVLFMEGAYNLWQSYQGPEARKIELRLKALSAGAEGGESALLIRQRLLSNLPALNRLLLNLPRLRQLDRFLEQSGLQINVAQLFGLAGLMALAVNVLAALVGLPSLFAAAFAGCALALPFLYVQHHRAQRIRKIERQLPEVLDLICRALRAGHAFSSGLKMAGEETPEPIANEFRITQDEVNFGISLQQALLNLATRVPSTDLRYFVIAVLIQRDTGGNLTEVLGNLSKLIRDRLKLLEKVRVLAAEGTFSAWILCLLPFAVAGLLQIIHPSFMTVLWSDPLGQKMIYSCALLLCLGAIWMRKIVRIHI
jgi:tight adherence protein B